MVDDGSDVLPLCAILLELTQSLGIGEGSYHLSKGKARAASAQVIETLALDPRPYFGIIGKNMKIDVGPNWTDTGVTWIPSSIVPAAALIDRWAPRLLAQPCVRYMRIVDTDYEAWENEELACNFASAKKPLGNRKTYWEPVIEKEMVDTSANPGRSVARDGGYLEALGHEMWLPKRFWSLTGADERQVKKALPTRDLGQGLLGVTLSAQPFTEDNPVPEPLRRLLFP